MVRFVDLRFMYPGQTRRFGGAWVQLGPNLNVVSQNFGMHAVEHVRQSGKAETSTTKLDAIALKRQNHRLEKTR